jgi:SAM-dependent methyltransferase
MVSVCLTSVVGSGGKTCYFAKRGATFVVGVDKDPLLVSTGTSFVASKGIGNVELLVGDAKRLPLSTGSFDIVVMTDAMEHIPRPNIELSLTESLRVLRPGGRLFLHFPPWTSPLAGHLYDRLWLPWCHLLFSDDALREALTWLGAPEQNGSLNYWDHFKELNRVTVDEFCGFLPQLSAKSILVERTTFTRFFGPLNVTRLPVLGKYLTRHLVCVLENQ